MGKTTWRWDYALVFGVLTLLGGFLRFWWVYNVPTKPVYDFATYLEIANNIFLYKGHTFRGEAMAFQGMGFPSAVGMVFRLFGSSDILIAKLFNTVLSVATMPVLWLVMRKLVGMGKGLVVMYAGVTLLPNYIVYNNVMATEPLFLFLFAMVLLLYVYRSLDWRFYPFIGALIGLMALTKSFFLAYPAVLAVTLWLTHKDWRKTVALFAVTTIAMCLVVAPWTYRNYQKFGRFIPVHYDGGYTLYLNNNANNTTGTWMPLKAVFKSERLQREIDKALSSGTRSEKLAYQLDPLFTAEALQWIVTNPLDFFKLGVLRLNNTYFSGAWDIHAWAMNELEKQQTWWSQTDYLRNANFALSASGFLIHMLSASGLLFTVLMLRNLVVGLHPVKRKLDSLMVIPAINIAFFSLVYFVFEGQARYNYPVLFLFIISLVVGARAIYQGMAIQIYRE